MPGVYIILNRLNGKGYIGSTVQSFKIRFWQHQSSLRRRKHANPHLQAAYDKYGYSAFMFRPLEHIMDRQLLPDREQFWLDQLNGRNGAYNMGEMALAPMLGRKASPETRCKMSQAHKGRSFNNGRKQSVHEKEKRRHSVEKLTADQVKLIRSMIADGVIHRKIAEIFGVSRTTIWSISDNRYYQWVEG